MRLVLGQNTILQNNRVVDMLKTPKGFQLVNRMT